MSKVITRSQLIKAIEVLGFEPNTILELHIFPTYATGEEIVTNLKGDDVKLGGVTVESGKVPRRTFNVQVEDDR
ncbi:hypothetical protein [Brevibacterium sp. CT2-23B]|uniref:hypothetical protein n=1 Tax=Brevibacterium sp. CT2-23B TaxID=2729630 RepID=UPI00155596BB|nr:hypothetical protein [Brevibacterium sp. CT2-23B]